MNDRSAPLPETVGIVGLGLIGGSLARSLKEARDSPRIVASSLDGDALDRALEEEIVDRVSRDPADVAATAMVVVYATPLDVTLDLLEAHRSVWNHEAVLTDVVSLKEPVARAVRKVGAAERWVGAHPMAGSEESGFGASRSDLFRGARVYLTRVGAGEEEVRTVEELWARTGAEVRWTDPVEHDRRMVWASHLPQLVANALAATLDEAGIGPDELGPGGRDMTRLAGSSPELWKGLLEAGGEREGEGLRAIMDELERLRKLLGSRSIDRVIEYMERTRRWRDQWS